MKPTFFIAMLLFFPCFLTGVVGQSSLRNSSSDVVETFKERMGFLRDNSTNQLFALHFQSMIDVVEAKENVTASDLLILQYTCDAFDNPDVSADPNEFDSYYEREWPLIIAWVSPTDGAVSYGRLKLPSMWDPNETYPLYIELHGLWNVADNPIDFMTYPFRNGPSTTFAFDDGFTFSPWGRGNFWYEGISEIDIWEGISALERILKIDQQRKYITGHSMGGYGAWSIASSVPEVWAGVGIYAGAFWWEGNKMLSADRIQNLSSIPVYIVCGVNDGLYSINTTAFNLLRDAGNVDVHFASFTGGHEYKSENVEDMYMWLRDFVNEDYVGSELLKGQNVKEFLVAPTHIRREAIFSIDLDEPDYVRLYLYDTTGRKVAKIAEEKLAQGKTVVRWSREGLIPGIYMYSFQSGGFSETGKIIFY